MHIAKIKIDSNPNVGLYGIATDKYMIISKKTKDSEVFKTDVIETTIASTKYVGIFLAGNSNGLLVPNTIENHEFEKLKNNLAKIDKNITLTKLETKYTALGNLILTNDKGCIISEKLEKNKKEIEDTLKVPVTVGTILNNDIVGALAITTNKGFLLNMDVEKEDFEFVKDCLKVEGDIGSVNFGGSFIKSGIIANSNGLLIGELTTGPEISRIDEALGFINA
ncbi:MAG: translation initiation factor IF-6 [DPANN group archaeon]|nr:translation initiation factor IF-6 [DPANN group archaeon]